MKSVLLSLLLLGASLAPNVAAAQAVTAPTDKARPAASEADPAAGDVEPNTIVAETPLTPPAPLREDEPAEGPRRAVWTPGYWSWDDARFVWHGGRFRTPPESDMRWVEPRWMARRDGWALLAGGWTAAPVAEPAAFVAWPGRGRARR